MCFRCTQVFGEMIKDLWSYLISFPVKHPPVTVNTFTFVFSHSSRTSSWIGLNFGKRGSDFLLCVRFGGIVLELLDVYIFQVRL